jgi:hypothetical protein
MQNSQRAKALIDLQNIQAQSFISPLISFEAFELKLSEMLFQVQKERSILFKFLQQRKKLKALEHLPKLVYFYHLINTTFAFRLTEEESMKWTVAKCINHIEQFESKEAIAHLKATFEEIKHIWNDVAQMAELVVCPGQLLDRAFEVYVLSLDDQTLLGSLIGHGNDLESHDEIFRMITALAKKQNEVLDLCEATLSPSQAKLLFDVNANDMPFNSLLSEADTQPLLLSGNLHQHEFEQLLLSNICLDKTLLRSSLQCNLEVVENLVSEF